MPPTRKRRVDLPDHVREAVLGDVGLSLRQAEDAEERMKVRIYLAIEQGLTTRELAEGLRISQSSVSNYAREGKEAYDRREQERSGSPGDDPVRPGEREPVG